MALNALALLSLASVASASLLDGTYPDISACVNTPSFYSCENTTAVTNTCCSPTPGGLVLQTQYWSTWTGLESKGQLLPKNSWTIHGLWPDNCDGSYEYYCDLSRQYDPRPSPAMLRNGTHIPAWNGTSIDKWVAEFGRDDLLDYMNEYWVNQGAPNAGFWAHEFSKHATCTSTFDVKCYGPNYKEHQDVVDFFDATIRAFHQYPTYDLLAAAGIVPSNKTSYTLSQLQNAIKSQTGAIPYFNCSNNHSALSEVWYFSHVYGTEQFGHYKTMDSTIKISGCNATGPIWYYERTKTSEREVPITAGKSKYFLTNTDSKYGMYFKQNTIDKIQGFLQ